MRIVLGADGQGKPLLDVIAGHLTGKTGLAMTDYYQPGFHADIADRVAAAIVSGNQDRGILFCGTGVGVCISANKVPGIRAALTHDAYSADHAARSLNAQIITLGARIIGPELAKAIVDVWLAAKFSGDDGANADVDAIDRIDRQRRRGQVTQSLGLAGSHQLDGECPPTQQSLLEEQRECSEAIRLNTIEALEAFLAKYSGNRSGCRSLAITALRRFEPGGPTILAREA